MGSEDAVASLLDQMRAQQGYEVPLPDSKMNPSQTEMTKSSSGDDTIPYQRLLCELDGYPDHTNLAGNQSIWNAHVAPHQSHMGDSATAKKNTSYDLPTNPQVEVVRRRAFEKFKLDCTEVLQQIQQNWGIKLPIPAMLEKWHMDAKLAEWQGRNQRKNEGGNGDRVESELSGDLPILVSTEEIYRLAIVASQKHHRSCFREPILLSKRASSLFQSTLEPEVKKAWAVVTEKSKNKDVSPSPILPPKFSKKADQVQKALYRCISQALDHFQHQLSQAVQLEKQQNLVQHKRKVRKVPKITHNEETDQYRVTHSGITLSVHAAYFEKLQRLFDRAQLACCSSELYSFEEALFCLLCRYDMLQGAGLQAGVPGRVMDTLLAHFDCRMECFASPLNCRYERFTSAFDLDRAFGSRGSFFDLDGPFFATGGCFQANPPFCEGVIDAMNRRIHDLIEAKTTNPLMFAVFVPAWKDCKAFQEGLLENPFLVKHLLLPNGKHFYAEGTQHRRKGSFRPASFDTSVLFYQNDVAKAKWPISDDVLDDLKSAFCDDPGTMDKTSTAMATHPKKRVTLTVQPSTLESKVRRNTQVGNMNLQEQLTGGRIQSRDRDESMEKKKKAKQGKTKTGKKRQFSDLNEESHAQLSLLQSLGLSADAGGGTSASPAGGFTKPITKKRR